LRPGRILLHEWGTLQGYVSANRSPFFAVRKSLENPPKIAGKSAGFRKLVLDTKREIDIGLYHATLLHGPGRQDAWIASAEFAEANPPQADSVSATTANRQTANPALDTEGRETRTRGNSQEMKKNGPADCF
jgi:hypothetical protein